MLQDPVRGALSPPNLYALLTGMHEACSLFQEESFFCENEVRWGPPGAQTPGVLLSDLQGICCWLSSKLHEGWLSMHMRALSAGRHVQACAEMPSVLHHCYLQSIDQLLCWPC